MWGPCAQDASALFAALAAEDGEGAELNGHAEENGVEEEEAPATKPKKGKKKGANAASLFAALQEDGKNICWAGKLEQFWEKESRGRK
jgi:hypothetical protein